MNHPGRGDISTLLQPWRLGSLEIPNRLVRSATEEGLSTGDGAPTQRLVDLTADLARGGVGLIVAGSAFICREGRGATNVTGIDRDALVEPLGRMCERCMRPADGSRCSSCTAGRPPAGDGGREGGPIRAVC